MSESPFAGHLEHTEAWVADHDLVGLTEDEVVAATEAEGFVVRVVVRDGSGGLISADYRPGRINLDLVDGRVSRIRGVY